MMPSLPRARRRLDLRAVRSIEARGRFRAQRPVFSSLDLRGRVAGIALRLSRRRQTLSALLAVAAMVVWFVVPTYAADYRLDTSGDARYGTLLHGYGRPSDPDPYPFHLNGGAERSNAGTLLMHEVGGGDVQSYCINLHGIRNTHAIFSSGPRQIDQVAYVLNHYFPVVNENGGLDIDHEASAVQLAIWHFSDGVDVGNTIIASWVPNRAWIIARANAIVAETDAHWHAWAVQQQVQPAIALSWSGTPVAPGDVTLSATVTGGPSGGAPDGTPITFTVTSAAGSVGGARSVRVPLSAGHASVSVHMDAPGSVAVKADVTVDGLAYEKLIPDNLPNNQILILATRTPVSGTASASTSFAGAPRMTLSKNVADGSGPAAENVDAKPGDSVTYTLSYANTGNATAAGVTVTDDLSQGPLALLDLGTVQLHGGVSSTLDKAHRVVTWTLGSVAPGAQGTVGFTALLPAALQDSGDGVDFCNVGTLTYGGGAPVPSNRACAHVTTTPHLITTKVVDASTANLGQTLHYTIAVTNDGNRGLTGVVVTDHLTGHNLDLLVDVSPADGGHWEASTRTITWTVRSLAAGAQTRVTFTAGLPSTGLIHGVDTCFVNVAQAGGGNSGGVYPSGPVSTCVHPAVCVQPAPVLHLVGPSQFTAGETATYRVIAANGGPGPIGPTVVTTTLPAGWAVTATSLPAQVSGDTVVWNVGTLQPGSSVALTIGVTVPSGASGTASASAVMTATDSSGIPDCPHPSASTKATASSPVVAAAVQGIATGPVQVTTPTTGSGGGGLLRDLLSGLLLMASGTILVTGLRRDPQGE